jgi:hypothetical protein
VSQEKIQVTSNLVLDETAAYTFVVRIGPNVSHTRERRYVDAPNRRGQSADAGPATFALVRILPSTKTRVLASIEYARPRKSAYSFTAFSCHHASPPSTITTRRLRAMTHAATVAAEAAGDITDVEEEEPSGPSPHAGSSVGRSAEERASIKRRAHRKSRYGCKNCKRRRIKVNYTA